MKTSTPLPLIFDISRFALHDGKGIRTTVFFKGCPLSCVWCHNPESIHPGPQITYSSTRCIGCNNCKIHCIKKAIITTSQGIRIDTNRCCACGTCTEECPSTALKMAGKYYPDKKLTDLLLADRLFYDLSKGGITFSGGEPTLFMDYLERVMIRIKKEAIPIAVQTCGMFSLPVFKKKVLPSIDTIFFDIKFIDSTLHKIYTGSQNSTILNNFIHLCKLSSLTVVAAIPIVPEITQTDKNLNAIAQFIKSAGCTTYTLRPYHPGGIFKKKMIGDKKPHFFRENPLGEKEVARVKGKYFSQFFEYT